MAKSTPKSILFDTYTAGIFGRTEGYANRVRQLYAQAVTELLKLAASHGVSEDEMFEFDKLPKKLREEANKILRLLYTSVYNEVQHGIRAEWEYANLSNDIIIKRIFGDAVFKNEGNHFARWFGRNQQAMDAFLKRKTGKDRLGLSERIWNYTGQLKDEMELALSVSMGQGESASAVSRKVRKYLQEPERLFRHVKGKDGKMRWSKAAKAYLKEHDVGRGQYLSSYKNAMRLTRTETNMAYRSSDYERWQQLDFVLGIHIQRAHRDDNDIDICELLQGDYPKAFKFTGWHPQCRCIATPILATPDEMIAMRKALKEGKDPRSVLAPGRYITEPPAAFTQWIDANRERIENAASVPYFIRDNYKDGDIDKGFAWVKTKKQRTQEEEQAVLDKWNERKRHNTLITKMGNNVYNVAAGYPDVDTSDLVSAINSGNIAKIEEQARSVAKQVAALNKQLKGMESLIDNPKQWLAQGFKVADLQKTFDSVESKMAEWEAKYNGDSWLMSNTTLEKYLLKKLTYEINDVEDKKKYSTWQVAQQAYAKQQTEIQDKVVWQDIQTQGATLSAKLSNGLFVTQIANFDKAVKNKDKMVAQILLSELDSWADINDVLQEALTFQTKSQPYLNLIAQLKQNIENDNVTEALNTVQLMQQKRSELAKAANRRASKHDLKPFSLPNVKKEQADKLIQEFEARNGWDEDQAETADALLRPQIEKTWANLTEEEKIRATKYTQTYSYLNEPLRNIRYAGYRSQSEYDTDLPILTAACRRGVTTQEMVVRRGTDDYPVVELGYSSLRNLKVGDEFTDGAFLSTAVRSDRGFFKEFNLVIVVPKGAQGLYAEPFSHFNGADYDFGEYGTPRLWNGSDKASFGGEREWIGQRGSRFRVLSKTGKTIYLQMIGQGYTQPTTKI